MTVFIPLALFLHSFCWLIWIFMALDFLICIYPIDLMFHVHILISKKLCNSNLNSNLKFFQVKDILHVSVSHSIVVSSGDAFHSKSTRWNWMVCISWGWLKCLLLWTFCKHESFLTRVPISTYHQRIFFPIHLIFFGYVVSFFFFLTCSIF